MQQTTYSTVSYSEAEDQVDRQDKIGYYVDQLLRRVVERPYYSIPQPFQYVTLGGPCITPADVLRLFGGRAIFRRACRRMNIIRRAALNDELDAIPIDLRTWTEWERPEIYPPFRDCGSWWCPHLDSPALFWYEDQGMEEETYRYPAVLDAGEFFQETESENWPEDADTDDDVEESAWLQATGPVDDEQYYI